MAKTIGENRVRIDFNVSNDGSVHALKNTSATAINLLEIIRQENPDPEAQRLISIAQTKFEEACMWAVKAATHGK